MVLDRSRNLLFIHIPKTGGTSIEYLLNIPLTPYNFFGIQNGLALQHYTASKMKTWLGEEYFNKCSKIAMVRNPYDRVVSEYYWTIKRDKKFATTFKEFLLKIKKIIIENRYDQSPHYDHYKPQSDFVFIDGKNVIDYLGKFENFNSFVEEIIPKFSLDKNKFGHHNKSEYNRDVDHFEDKECREIVNEIYQMDFINFDYEMIS